jgi:hypothetical protein
MARALARGGPRRLRGAACALVLLASIEGVPPPDKSHGQGIFWGDRPVPAYIAGQDFALPASASRCGNCHGEQAPQRIAPVLTAASLTQATSRRGGPPSRYEPASFCRLLRTGVDPAFVVVPRAMPRYDLSEADCAALWAYLLDIK